MTTIFKSARQNVLPVQLQSWDLRVPKQEGTEVDGRGSQTCFQAFPFSSARNQARATAQSRFTVIGETSSASAVSSIDSPPK
jgi:hypothetical protein